MLILAKHSVIGQIFLILDYQGAATENHGHKERAGMCIWLLFFNCSSDVVFTQRLQKTSTMSDETSQPQRSPSPPILRVAIASDVNFQYLKHVVIKFMCSREDEALQLIRAVSTLLEFTQQEEEHIKSYLNYKV